MEVWTIAWWTETELAKAVAALRDPLQDWGEQWGGNTRFALVEAASWPGSGTEHVWQRVTGSGDRDGVWISHPESAMRSLAAVLCDDEGTGVAAIRHGGSLSLAVARQAWGALAASLCGHFGWTAADDAPSALPPGLERGGLCLSVRVGEAELRIALAAGVARAVAGRGAGLSAAPLDALQDVVGRRRITLNVALRPVRLEIGSLCSLAIGDVVALDHKLDEPATLYAEDASPVAEVHLSRTGSQKAIRLDRAAP